MRPARPNRRLHAPLEDGGTLTVPEWSLLPQLVADNTAQLADASIEIQGKPLTELAHSARRNLLTAARRYAAEYHDLPAGGERTEPPLHAPIVMAGHQPQLFHPGVWYKNFTLARLADRVDATAVNLVIDSDLARSTTIRVPAGSGDELRFEDVPYDEPGGDVPLEERRVTNEATFASFAKRVAHCLDGLVDEPFVRDFWPVTLARHGQQPNLGRCIAQSRHLVETEWMRAGAFRPSLEIPQSAVCQLDEFRWFVAHLLANIAEFVTAHNRALADYRRAHRLRSRTHPVPNLATADGWHEAPFWVWSTAEPLRRPLYARPQAGEISLTDRAGFTCRLPLSADGNPTAAVEQLGKLEAAGRRIRTRALTTTLFARLVLSDLFLHGIGGAKYDEVTDQIMRRFFRIEPPRFGVVSATLRLPIPRPNVTPQDSQRIAGVLRDLTYNPDRYVDRATVQPSQLSNVSALLDEKRRWIASPKTPDNARQRHFAIAGVNEALQPFVAERREVLQQRFSELNRLQRAERIAEYREFAFCLFPENALRGLLLDSWQTKP